jgi:hypothetical protein
MVRYSKTRNDDSGDKPVEKTDLELALERVTNKTVQKRRQYLCNIPPILVRAAHEEAHRQLLETGLNITWQAVIREWVVAGRKLSPAK